MKMIMIITTNSFDCAVNYTQVTTAGVKKGYHADPNAPFHVRIQALQCGNMELHIKNLIPSWRSSGGWYPLFTHPPTHRCTLKLFPFSRSVCRQSYQNRLETWIRIIKTYN